jgi:hypothetical protein
VLHFATLAPTVNQASEGSVDRVFVVNRHRSSLADLKHAYRQIGAPGGGSAPRLLYRWPLPVSGQSARTRRVIR